MEKTMETSKGNKDKVLVDRNVMEDILKRLNEVEKNSNTNIELKPTKTHVARMRMVDGYAVVGFTRPYYWVINKEDMFPQKPIGDRVYVGDLLVTKDGKTFKEKKCVLVEDFLNNAEKVNVQIVKQVKEEEKISHGQTEVKEVEGYKTIETGEIVNAEETKEIVTCTIKFPDNVLDGRTMVVDVNSLNI